MANIVASPNRKYSRFLLSALLFSRAKHKKFIIWGYFPSHFFTPLFNLRQVFTSCPQAYPKFHCFFSALLMNANRCSFFQEEKLIREKFPIAVNASINAHHENCNGDFHPIILFNRLQR